MTDFYITNHYSGSSIPEDIHEFARKISKAVQTLHNKNYSTYITEFGIVLRVSGDISTFKEENRCFHSRLYKKKKSIQIEVTIQQDVWKQEEETFKSIIREFVVCSYKLMIEKIKKEKLQIEGDQLLDDIRLVIAEQSDIT